MLSGEIALKITIIIIIIFHISRFMQVSTSVSTVFVVSVDITSAVLRGILRTFPQISQILAVIHLKRILLESRCYLNSVKLKTMPD